MKQLVCIYCEGSDTKIAVVNKDKDKVKVLKTASVDVLQPALQLEDGVSDLNIEGEDLTLQNLKNDNASTVTSSSQNILSSELIGKQQRHSCNSTSKFFSQSQRKKNLQNSFDKKL
ncbi:MAG: hypothetical protein P8Z35_08945 [Ignavibacteriaceae bacterium]